MRPEGTRPGQAAGPSSSNYAAGESLRRNWGWVLALGILSIILGILAIGAAFFVTLATVLLFGVLLIIGGVIQIINAFSARRWRGLFVDLFVGALYVAAGGVLVWDPIGGAITLTLLLAAFFVAVGILRIIAALQMRRTQSWGWVLFSGLLSLILGILIFAQWPATGVWVIGLFVGIDLLFTGWAMVMLALRWRNWAG